MGENEVADVVSQWTKIPVKKLSEGESERLLKLEGVLHERVVGQNEAVCAVAKAIRRGRRDSGFKAADSFLFLGPTGVGKTELSKALCGAMFGTENAMIPCGYVGIHGKRQRFQNDWFPARICEVTTREAS